MSSRTESPTAGPSPGPRTTDGSIWCIVVAGGSGRRFGSLKQFDMLDGSRVIDRSVSIAASVCDGVVVVVPAEAIDTSDARIALADAVVAGGATRAASVRAGLAVVPAEAEVVLVHDAARPLASIALYERVIAAVRAGGDAVVPAVAVIDTIRAVDGGVVDRDRLRAVQTPQGFPAQVLRRVHASGSDATDDAGLVEADGGHVTLVEGERTNLKLTEPADMAVAAAWLSQPAGSDGQVGSGGPGTTGTTGPTGTTGAARPPGTV